MKYRGRSCLLLCVAWLPLSLTRKCSLSQLLRADAWWTLNNGNKQRTGDVKDQLRTFFEESTKSLQSPRAEGIQYQW